MKTLFIKELSVFLNTQIGYIIIIIFLLTNGIVLWSDVSSFNIINYGYANMDMFFMISPLLFMLFVPAISMKSFSEEYNIGTIETLITKPISKFQIIISKFLAIFTIIFFSILPTIIYVLSIYYLGEIKGNLDLASIIGSYFGLILLSTVFISVSIYSSAISLNQMFSLVISIMICVLFYYGFDLICNIYPFNKYDFILERFGISYYYEDMSKGLIRFSHIIYFLSINFLFLKLTEIHLLSKKKK